jgi:hypothetical protein
MAMKNTAAKMAKREDTMRNPKNVAKRPSLVIAVGVAPTLGKKSGRAFNKNAQKIKR